MNKAHSLRFWGRYSAGLIAMVAGAGYHLLTQHLALNRLWCSAPNKRKGGVLSHCGIVHIRTIAAAA